MALTILTNQTPSTTDVDAIEGQPGVSLGVTWYSEHDGILRGIRFYLGNRNYDGAQVKAGLFNLDSGDLLTSQPYTISNSDAIGFVTIPLTAQPLVKRNQRYIAAVFFPCDTSPDGKAHYSVTSGVFTSAGISNPPLHIFKNDAILSRRNGLYGYGSDLILPTSSFNSANYFIDVSFDYMAAFPVRQSDGTYKSYPLKYRANGQWHY